MSLSTGEFSTTVVFVMFHNYSSSTVCTSIISCTAILRFKLVNNGVELDTHVDGVIRILKEFSEQISQLRCYQKTIASVYCAYFCDPSR